MSNGSVEQLVRLARNAAIQSSADFLELSSLMCWDAVIRCATKADALSPDKAERLSRIDWQEDFSPFISHYDRLVRSRREMRHVPAGAFLAFYRVESPDAYHRYVGDMRGKRRILHAMLSLGNGWAAGNKNSCIGIGHHVGWELLHLASDLNWVSGRKYTAINGFPVGTQKFLPLRIRYRKLSRYQDTTSSNTTEILDPHETCLVSPGETWSVGPLADCVAIAAISRATSSTRGQTSKPKIFLWHVNGGLVSSTDMSSAKAFQALQSFCQKEKPSEWIFVHGNGTHASPIGRRGFHQQTELTKLIESTEFVPGSISLSLKSYSGTELLIDSNGVLLNEEALYNVDMTRGVLLASDMKTFLNNDGSPVASEEGALNALIRMRFGQGE